MHLSAVWVPVVGATKLGVITRHKQKGQTRFWSRSLVEQSCRGLSLSMQQL